MASNDLIDITGLTTFLGECRNEFANNQEFITVSNLVDELNKDISNALDNNPVTIRNGTFFTQRLESGEVFNIKPNSLLFVQGGSNVNEFVDSSGQLISTLEPDAGISTMETGIIFSTNLGPNTNTGLAGNEFRSFLMLKGSFSITNISNILTTRNYKATKNNFCLRAKERIYVFALEYDESLYNTFKANSLSLTGARSDGSGERNTVFIDGNIAPESNGTQKYSSKIHMFDRDGEKVIDILAKQEGPSYVGVYEPKVWTEDRTQYNQDYSQQQPTDFVTYRYVQGNLSTVHKLSDKVNGSTDIRNMEYIETQTEYKTKLANNQINSTTLYFIKDAELGG